MPKVIDNARDTILSTARNLLKNDGYEALNMREIAGACGMATGTVYNYFKAKEELVFALMSEDWKLALQSMDAALDKKLGAGGYPSVNPADCLADIFHPLKSFVQTHQALWAQMSMGIRENSSQKMPHHDKTTFMAELSLRVGRLQVRSETQGDSFVLDFVCTSLATYAQERDCDFIELSRILVRLLDGF
jgi:AcrR family transcriptional regulator